MAKQTPENPENKALNQLKATIGRRRKKLETDAQKLKNQFPAEFNKESQKTSGSPTNDHTQAYKNHAYEELINTGAQRKSPPTYYSSFHTLFINPQTKMGKQARNTFLGLLLADTVITGGGGLLYGVSKNGSHMDLINDLHNLISKYSDTLKLCAEIIPPSLLFISIIILLAGIKVEKHAATLAYDEARTAGRVSYNP